jgi:hypothetical protein
MGAISSLYWVTTPLHVSGSFGWKGTAIPFHQSPPTEDLEIKQIPFATYIHSTS